MKHNLNLTPEQDKRRWNRQMFFAMSVYLVVLFVCTHYLKLTPQTTPPGALRIVLALLPTLPVIWVMWSLIGLITRMDELHRRVNIEAFAIAAGITAFLSLTYGFLEDFAGLPHIPAWWWFILIDFVWGGSTCLLLRRYR
jgi:hypothetical protein